MVSKQVEYFLAHILFSTFSTYFKIAPGEAGAPFRATVSQPVMIDGKTVIPEGAPAESVIVEAKESGRMRFRHLHQPGAGVTRSSAPRVPPFSRSLRPLRTLGKLSVVSCQKWPSLHNSN